MPSQDRNMRRVATVAATVAKLANTRAVFDGSLLSIAVEVFHADLSIVREKLCYADSLSDSGTNWSKLTVDVER